MQKGKRRREREKERERGGSAAFKRMCLLVRPREHAERETEGEREDGVSELAALDTNFAGSNRARSDMGGRKEGEMRECVRARAFSLVWESLAA